MISPYTTFDNSSEETRAWLSTHCGARTSWVIAEIGTPYVEVD